MQNNQLNNQLNNQQNNLSARLNLVTAQICREDITYVCTAVCISVMCSWGMRAGEPHACRVHVPTQYMMTNRFEIFHELAALWTHSLRTCDDRALNVCRPALIVRVEMFGAEGFGWLELKAILVLVHLFCSPRCSLENGENAAKEVLEPVAEARDDSV